MTRLTILMTSAAFALSGCLLALPPKGVSAEQIAAYDEAVASIGCDMIGESDYLPVELQTGLTREQVIQVTEYKLAREEAVTLPEGGVRLTTGVCAV
ncbi:hypothetical protein [Primorskyibacter sedentarius]|uniref:NADH dehydrogenase subunit E n=1 Tax=Primorskyibacter sedentarius TaxID=745311 RepID=A0A4R3JAB4_9RHOB|nr:hypothetical protein [Primorskyibacter sedentarius]TCS62355.1 hypothetical protein EDD52_10995 [Primorskyibacter sedentarius]